MIMSEWEREYAGGLLSRKFPFLTRVGRYVGLGVTSFVYWSIIGLGISVVAVFVVGFSEVVESVVGFFSLVFEFLVVVRGVFDWLFVVGVFVYGLWVLSRREVFHPGWSPESDDIPRVRSVVLWVVVSGVFAVLVVSGVFYGIGLIVGVSGVLCWVSSYVLARKMNVLVSDDHWQAEWFSLETPWKWPMWVSVAYGPYFVLEGGLRWVPEWGSLLFSVSVPLIGLLYLVYRSVEEVWGSNNGLSEGERLEMLELEGDLLSGEGVSKAGGDSEWDYE